MDAESPRPPMLAGLSHGLTPLPTGHRSYKAGNHGPLPARSHAGFCDRTSVRWGESHYGASRWQAQDFASSPTCPPRISHIRVASSQNQGGGCL